MRSRSIGLAAGYAISTLGGVLSLVAYAHTLTPEDYGRFAVYLAWIEVVQGVLFQWHRLAVVRFWSSIERDDFDSYLLTSHSIWLVIAFAVVSSGFSFVVLYMHSRVEWVGMLCMAIAKSAALYAQDLSRAAGAVVKYSLGAVLITIGSAISGVIAYHNTQSISSLMLASTLTFVCAALLCITRIRTKASFSHLKMVHVREMITYGLPLVPVFIGAAVMTRLDRPILAKFESASVVGVYAAASALIYNAISATCMVVTTPGYPWLLREKQKRSVYEFKRVHARAGVLMFFGAFLAATLLYCLRDFAVPLLLGNRFAEGAKSIVLPLIVITLMGMIRTHFFDQAYHLFSKTKRLMKLNILTMSSTLILIYLGSWANGIQGLVTGLLVANFISLVASAFAIKMLVDVYRMLRGVISLAMISGLGFIGGQLIERVVDDSWQREIYIGLVVCCIFGLGAGIANKDTVRTLVRGRI